MEDDRIAKLANIYRRILNTCRLFFSINMDSKRYAIDSYITINRSSLAKISLVTIFIALCSLKFRRHFEETPHVSDQDA